jgi:hypothetical protein
MIIANAEKVLTEGLIILVRIYVKVTRESISGISKAALNDGSYLRKALGGTQQVTPRQYDKVVDYMIERLKPRHDWDIVKQWFDIQRISLEHRVPEGYLGPDDGSVEDEKVHA